MKMTKEIFSKPFFLKQAKLHCTEDMDSDFEDSFNQPENIPGKYKTLLKKLHSKNYICYFILQEMQFLFRLKYVKWFFNMRILKTRLIRERYWRKMQNFGKFHHLFECGYWCVN